MITYSHIMVRYGELSTKGKNKNSFIKALFENIEHALKDFSSLSFEKRFDHIYIYLNGCDAEPVIARLQDVSGIHSLSLVHKCEKDIDVIKQDSLELIKLEKGKTFKVNAKRGDKSFPIVSDDIVRQVAPIILRNTELKVDVHNPDISLNIEVREEAAYIYCHTYLGAGGYPLGMSGKALCMLSGGIDSPVACYLMLKRGIKIECIHFASPPYTQVGVIYKLEDILSKLTRYQPSIKLHIVPFTKLQEAIYDNVPESYCITVMRRMMYRIATLLANRKNCPLIANGESLGQVASQTAQSIKVINEVTSMPIIRPCATMDKLEIIDISKKIDTYDISIRPFEDCCTIFTPKNPKTMPNFDSVVEFESKFDYMSLIKECIANIETKEIKE